jgi:ferritin-like metal-binding protein YciE
MKLETLHARYVDELEDLYSAEQLFPHAPPQAAKAAPVPESGKAVTDQLEEMTAGDARSSEIG